MSSVYTQNCLSPSQTNSFRAYAYGDKVEFEFELTEYYGNSDKRSGPLQRVHQSDPLLIGFSLGGLLTQLCHICSGKSHLTVSPLQQLKIEESHPKQVRTAWPLQGKVWEIPLFHTQMNSAFTLATSAWRGKKRKQLLGGRNMKMLAQATSAEDLIFLEKMADQISVKSTKNGFRYQEAHFC